MRTIHKYQLWEGAVTMNLPRSAQVLTVQEQQGVLHMWVLLDQTELTVPRVFYVLGTGWIIPDHEAQMRYIATVQLLGGDLVWHVFEGLPLPPHGEVGR